MGNKLALRVGTTQHVWETIIMSGSFLLTVFQVVALALTIKLTGFLSLHFA